MTSWSKKVTSDLLPNVFSYPKLIGAYENRENEFYCFFVGGGVFFVLAMAWCGTVSFAFCHCAMVFFAQFVCLRFILLEGA